MKHEAVLQTGRGTWDTDGIASGVGQRLGWGPGGGCLGPWWGTMNGQDWHGLAVSV